MNRYQPLAFGEHIQIYPSANIGQSVWSTETVAPQITVSSVERASQEKQVRNEWREKGVRFLWIGSRLFPGGKKTHLGPRLKFILCSLSE